MNNEVIHDAWVLPVIVTDPVTPQGGDPVRWGFLTGVAVDDENAAGVTVVDFGQRVHNLTVTDRVGGGIAVGATLYYADATNDIDNVTTGTPFGYLKGALIGAGGNGVREVLHVPGHGAATLGAGVVSAANIAADAVETAKILNANVTLAKMAAESVDGSKIAEAASSSVIGAVPILYHQTIADVGAPTNYDITVTSKIHVVDAWIVNLAAGHATDDTIQVFNAAAAITDAMKKTATDHKIVHAATIDHAACDIANGGTLRFTATKATNIACEAYVLAYRVA
jgi:hypothetical protein